MTAAGGQWTAGSARGRHMMVLFNQHWDIRPGKTDARVELRDAPLHSRILAPTGRVDFPIFLKEMMAQF